MLSSRKVLLLSSDELESVVLDHILSEHVGLERASSLAEMQIILEGNVCDAVFCGWSFHKGDWNTALEEIQQRCPEVPVIVFCHWGGEREWTEVLQAGGFDLLVPPYQKNTVLPVLEQAVASYEARQLYKTMPYANGKAS